MGAAITEAATRKVRFRPHLNEVNGLEEHAEPTDPHTGQHAHAHENKQPPACPYLDQTL